MRLHVATLRWLWGRNRLPNRRLAVGFSRNDAEPCCTSCRFAVYCGARTRLQCSWIWSPKGAPDLHSREWLRSTSRGDSAGFEPTSPTASFRFRVALRGFARSLARCPDTFLSIENSLPSQSTPGVQVWRWPGVATVLLPCCYGVATVLLRWRSVGCAPQV